MNDDTIVKITMEDWPIVKIWQLLSVEFALLLALLLVISPLVFAQPVVETHAATNITIDGATLNGETSSFGSAAMRPTFLSSSVHDAPTSNPSFTVLVPAGANFAVVQIMQGDGCHSGGAPTATLDGFATTQFLTNVGGPASGFRITVLYRVSPILGSQTLQLGNAAGCAAGYTHAIGFSTYSGVDTVTPMTTGGAFESFVCRTGTLTFTVFAASAHQWNLVTMNTFSDGCDTPEANDGQMGSPGGFTNSWGFLPGTVACDTTPRQCGEGGITTSVSVSAVPNDAQGVRSISQGALINGAVATCTSASVSFSYGREADLSDAISTTPVVQMAPGEFSADIEGLEDGTRYYFRAVANNVCGNGLGAILNFFTESEFLQLARNVFIIVVFISLVIFFLVFAYIVKKKRGGSLFERFR